MYKELHRLVESASALGAARLAESLGITPGEISQRQALKTYGSWFALALRDQRIQPARIEAGHAGTKFYRVVDILALKTADAAQATLLNTL
jgi:hypothetical protein